MKDYSKTIETERLILRKFELGDAADHFDYCSRSEVTKFLSFSTYLSPEQSVQYLSGVVLPAYEGQCYRWAIELKSEHKVIGCIDVVRMDLGKKSAELGYVLSSAYWGKSIMPEAGKAVVKYLFEEGFERICAYHNVENRQSGRVMQKIGMKFEGTLRRFALDNRGELVDCKLYSIIKDDLI